MFGYSKFTALVTLTFATFALSNPVPAPKANAKVVKMRGRQVADVGPVGVSVPVGPVGPVSVPIGGVGVANGAGVLGTGGDDNDVGGYIPLIFGGDDSGEDDSEGSTDEGSMDEGSTDEGSEDTTETPDDEEESTDTEASVGVSDETSV